MSYCGKLFDLGALTHSEGGTNELVVSNKAAGSALERLGNEKPEQALLVSNDRFFIARRNRLATLAARQGLPTIYPFHEMADLWIGKLWSTPGLPGSASCPICRPDSQGEPPADLPVVQMNKFELASFPRQGIGLTPAAGGL